MFGRCRAGGVEFFPSVDLGDADRGTAAGRFDEAGQMQPFQRFSLLIDLRISEHDERTDFDPVLPRQLMAERLVHAQQRSIHAAADKMCIRDRLYIDCFSCQGDIKNSFCDKIEKFTNQIQFYLMASYKLSEDTIEQGDLYTKLIGFLGVYEKQSFLKNSYIDFTEDVKLKMCIRDSRSTSLWTSSRSEFRA